MLAVYREHYIQFESDEIRYILEVYYSKDSSESDLCYRLTINESAEIVKERVFSDVLNVRSQHMIKIREHFRKDIHNLLKEMKSDLQEAICQNIELDKIDMLYEHKHLDSTYYIFAADYDIED